MVFEGTPLRSIRSEFDKAALDQCVDEHASVIEYYLQDMGLSASMSLDQASFDRDVINPVSNYMDDHFNVDVFQQVWVAEYEKLNPDFHAEIPVTQQHLKAESADKVAAKKAELARMSVDEVKLKTKNDKRSDRKAKRKLEKEETLAQEAADALISSDDEATVERDHSVKVNPYTDLRTPRPSKNKTLDVPGSILTGPRTPEPSAAVLMAKEEAQKATEEAAAEEDPSRKRALLLEALQLEQGAGRIDPGKAGSGNTGTGGYGGKVSLSDLPGSLKKSLDYDSTTSVTDFFDNLNDALVTQHRKAYVPYLLACCKGKLLTKFRQELRQCGGVEDADYDSCALWMKAELRDPEEATKLQYKFRAMTQGDDKVEMFLRNMNDVRDKLDNLDKNPSQQEYEFVIMQGVNKDILAECHKHPDFTDMKMKKKLKYMAACETSLAMSAKISGAPQKKANFSKAAARKRRRAEAEATSDAESDDSDSGSITMTTAEFKDRLNQHHQMRMNTETKKAKRLLYGKVDKDVESAKKKAAKARNKGRGNPTEEKVIPSYATVKTAFEKLYDDSGWLAKRVAHDKLVDAGTKKASDAPHLYRLDRWDDKYACLQCKKTGHTQDRCKKK